LSNIVTPSQQLCFKGAREEEEEEEEEEGDKEHKRVGTCLSFCG
jgi:hypothetical protein